MNDATCHGQCVIVPLCTNKIAIRLLDILEKSGGYVARGTNDNVTSTTKSYVFDSNDSSSDVNFKSSTAKQSSENKINHFGEDIIFKKMSTQTFIASRSADDISIDNVIFSKKSYHMDLVGIKSDLIDSGKFSVSNTNSTTTRTKPEKVHVPLEVVLNSRLCSTKKSSSVIKSLTKTGQQTNKQPVRKNRSFSVSDSSGRKSIPLNLHPIKPNIPTFKPVRYLSIADIIVNNNNNMSQVSSSVSENKKKNGEKTEKTHKKTYSIDGSDNNSDSDESEYEILSDQTRSPDKMTISGLNFIPFHKKSLLKKTVYLENYTLSDWIKMHSMMLNYNLSFTDAQRMDLVTVQDNKQKTLSDMDYSMKKIREVNLHIPLFELYNTYKISFEMYLMNSESPEIMDNLMINMLTTMFAREYDTNSDDSEDSGSYHENSNDIQRDIKKTVQNFENTRPKKPLFYVITIDLTEKNINFKKAEQLLSQIYQWMALDSIPEGYHELFFSDELNKNKSLRDRMILTFLRTNLMAKNKSFVVLMAHLPSKYVIKQSEDIIEDLKKNMEKSKKTDMVDIDVVTPRNDKKSEENVNDQQKNINTSDKKSEEGSDKHILELVESNTQKILSCTKKVFSKNFFFMNIDFDEELQVNYAFQKLSTKILGFSIGDFSNFKLHALPNKTNESSSIKNYSKNVKYKSVQDSNTSWDLVKSFSLDLLSCSYDT